MKSSIFEIDDLDIEIVDFEIDDSCGSNIEIVDFEIDDSCGSNIEIVDLFDDSSDSNIVKLEIDDYSGLAIQISKSLIPDDGIRKFVMTLRISTRPLYWNIIGRL